MHRFDRKSNLAVAFLAIQLVLTSGCGYRSVLAASAPTSGKGASDHRPRIRVAVLTLRNDSPEPWLDRLVADAMRREFGARGRVDFVNDPNAADFVLRGRIGPLEERSRSFSRFVAAVEYGVTLQLDLEVLLRGGDVIRLDSAMLSESDVFLASADIEVTRSNRLEVLRRLSDLLASRVADSIELIERPIQADATEEGG